MKKIFLLILIAIGLVGYSQDFQWVKDLSESSSDFPNSTNSLEIVDIEVDASGYVYVLGNFKGAVDVAPGSPTLMLTSLGGIDLFIIKYNQQGDVIDTYVSANDGQRSGGTNTDEVAKDMVLTTDGYLYVTGYFEADYYFWGYWQESDVTLDCDCSHNMFIAKIRTGGFYVDWAKEPYSCNADMEDEYISGEKITIKGTDEIFVAGHYYGYPAIVNGTSFNATDSKDDLFFAKINSSGTYQWGKEIKSNGDNQEYITGIAAGSYLYITGYFDDDATLDMNPSTISAYNLTSTGYHDIFLGMYNPSTGNWYSSTYIGNIGSTSDDYSTSIDVDASNNVYLSGYSNASADLDIKTGTQTNSSGFIVKYNSLLSYQWHMHLGSARGVAKIDEEDNIVVNGRFNYTVNFNPLGTAYNLTNNSQYSSRYALYLGKYDNTGGLITMKVLGADKDMAKDGNSYDPSTFNNLFLLGCSKATTDFVIYGKYEELNDFDAGVGVTLSSPSTFENGRYLALYSHCAKTVINTPLTDKQVCEGEGLYIYANASGNNLSYLWHIDDDPVSDGFNSYGNISGSENPVLAVTDISSNAGGLEYNCQIISSCDDPVFTNDSYVDVDRKPILNSSPGNMTECEGNTINLAVSTQYATSFQWLVNDGSGSFQALSDNAEYSGTQTATLTINNVQPSQSYYQYKCYITGDCPPELYSNPATIIVNPDPNIQTHPVNSSVCEGSATTFSVSTNGGGLNYQWQRSNDGGATFVNIANNSYYSGVQTSSLTVSNALISFNNYEYKCVISGSCGADVTSNTAILTVNELASLMSQPTSVEECEYEDITFSVNATGYSLNYRWQVNEGSGWSNLNNGGSYSNVTNASLDVSYIGSALDGNQYRCLVSSGCSANIYSNTVDLSVSQSPSISINSSDGTDLCQGDNTILSITGGNASYIYQWKRNYSSIDGQTSDATTVDQSGVYSIYAENTVGCSSESEPITINVHALPNATITVIGNSEFCDGNYVELIVPSGNGYTYEWYDNTTLVDGATSNSLITTTGGNYHAEITNTYGCQSTSAAETITVNPLPTVSLSPSNVQICQGETALITADDNADYIYQWKQNNLNIAGENTNTLVVSENGMYNAYIMNSTTGCNYTSDYVSVVVNTLPTPEIEANGTLTYCVDDQIELSLVENYNSYEWNDATGNTTLTVDASGTYSVTVTDANGCQSSDEMIINEQLVPTPNICMVTVDTAINKNLIVWENLPNVTGIASYNVYKLESSSYQLLGNVLYNDTTEFVDITSQPDLHSDQYAIASVDSCGNIAAYSPFHQTMNLSIVDGTGDGIALIWTKYIDEAGVNNPIEYEIYRGVGNLNYFSSITGGLSDYNYNIPTTVENERFIIVVQRPVGCAPLNQSKASGGPYYQSVSNIEDEGVVATNLNRISSIGLEIFPNPMKDYTIIKSDTKIEQIRIYSITGEMIRDISNLNTNEYKLIRNKLAVGSYIIDINKTVHKKLIIE